tara:strand:- start:275 stop:631 length:357 start_codon:yes stop_codon:yes gene_type:complete
MVVASSESPLVVMGSFCNASAIIAFLRDKGVDVTIVCSGRLGEEVIEDSLCAEYLKFGLENNLADFRLAPEDIYEECLTSPSYLMLKSAGLEDDFEYCMKINSHDLVPVLDGDGFILL